MKKRLFALLLCIALLLTRLPVTAAAANATKVLIYGVELTRTNPYYHNEQYGGVGTVDNNATDANAYFDVSTGTLTLNNLYVAQSTAYCGIRYAIFADGNLTICLEGDSRIETASYVGRYACAAALYVKGDLNVKVAGNDFGRLTAVTLEVTDSVSSGGVAESYGVYVSNNLTINTGAMLYGRVIGSASANRAYMTGVLANNINVAGGHLDADTTKVAKGKNEAGDKGFNVGLHARDTLTVTAGSVYCVSDGAEGTENASYGIYASDINASGGTIIGGLSDSGTADSSIGIIAHAEYDANENRISGGDITVSGTADVSAIGGTALVNSCGMIAQHSITVSGGSIIAYGDAIKVDGERKAVSAGIMAGGNGIAVSGGIVEAEGEESYNCGGLGESYGILCQIADGTALTVSGGQVSAAANNADIHGYGVYTDGGDISISGGLFMAVNHGASGASLSSVPVFGPGIMPQGSTSSLGAGIEDYVAADNSTYNWVFVPKIPALPISADPSDDVANGDTVTLTATPVNISSPTYQWYSNTESNTENGTAIPGATAQTYTPPTTTAGTMYYYCIANQITTGNIVGVTVAAPIVTSVAVNPASVSIEKGGYQTFNANVFGSKNPAQTVNWTVEGGVTGTAIDENGVLTIAADETASTLTVKATSTVDDSKSGTATVTVTTPAPEEHEFKQGSDSKWTKGGSSGLEVTVDADYSKFTGVSVDGKAISDDNYTAESGSTVVALTSAYLETLSDGQHTLRVNFTDGYAETKFTVIAAEVPNTADDAQPLLWLGIALTACAGLAAGVALGQRKRQNG